MDVPVARLRRMTVAVFASAAVLFASAAPLAAGHLTLDRECAPALPAGHDHAAHRLERSADAAPDHCVACHVARVAGDWARARTLFDAAMAPLAGAAPADRSFISADSSTDYTRGPPSLQI